MDLSTLSRRLRRLRAEAYGEPELDGPDVFQVRDEFGTPEYRQLDVRSDAKESEGGKKSRALVSSEKRPKKPEKPKETVGAKSQILHGEIVFPNQATESSRSMRPKVGSVLGTIYRESQKSL